MLMPQSKLRVGYFKSCALELAYTVKTSLYVQAICKPIDFIIALGHRYKQIYLENIWVFCLLTLHSNWSKKM